MEKKFIFDKVRLGTGKENQIAIQGFCDEEFVEKVLFHIVLKERANEKVIQSEVIVSSIPPLKRIDITDVNITKMVTIIFGVPKTSSNSFQISLEAEIADETENIYSISGNKIKKIAKELNTCLEAVIVQGENVLLKGWAVDSKPINIAVYDKSKNSIKDMKVEWTVRHDIKAMYVEAKKDLLGYTITVPKSDKIYLEVEAGRAKQYQKVPGLNLDSGSLFSKKLKRYYYKVILSLKNEGFGETCKKVKNRIQSKILQKPREYNKWFINRRITEIEMEEQKTHKFEYEPLFSIVVPLYETDEKFLFELISSLKAQTYSKWEVCFSDGSKDTNRLHQIIRRYDDERIKYISEKKGPLGISSNTNQALSIAKGEYIVLGDHDDLFEPDALYECVKILNEEKVDVIYTDEDKIDEKSKLYFEPNLKPDFNIDLLRSNNYICHMFVVSKTLVEKVGMFSEEYDGAQDYDFIFRCVEGANKVYHIPKVLYHWRSHRGSTASSPEAKLYAFEAGKRAIESHYKRIGLDATVEAIEEYGFYKTNYKIIGNPMISIVIPNKDHIQDLKKCMDSIEQLSDYQNYEFVIVENNSTEPTTFEYYDEINKRDNVQVVYWDKEFNYSAINNYGAKYAKGEYILLLNNDTSIINADCLRQMLGYCQREDVGIVGARLYYEDGAIQHAGVVIGYGGIAGHAFVGHYEEDNLYMSRTKVACDYSAVTAACLMTKKNIYEQVGGLDEAFKVAFNDIDFCMKVRQLGKLVVYNANAKLYHYESKSRGLEDTPEKKERFRTEKERFIQKWPEIIRDGDPYYNINLALDRADFSVRE